MTEDLTETPDRFEPEVDPRHLEIFNSVKNGALTPKGFSRILDQDGLVGECLNINGFERRLADYLKNGVEGALVAIDVDEFKRFNDSLGHPAGDDLLRLAGKILFQQTRSHPPQETKQKKMAEKRLQRRPELDLIARAGDEFLVYLVGAKSQGAVNAARRIRNNIVEEARKLFPDYGSEQTISLGITETKTENDNVKALRQKADSALYEAKAGKDKTNTEDAIVVY